MDIFRKIMAKVLGGKKVAPTPSPTPSPTPTPSPYPTPKAIPIAPDVEQTLTQKIFPITRKHEIPDSVAAGQFAAEGRLKGLGASRNNYYNIGAYDSNLSATQSYPNPEKGIEAYAKLMRGIFTRANGTVDSRYLPAYEKRATPSAMIREIQRLGYASRPDYAEFVMSTPEYKKYDYGR
jgi:hypothetical protein